MKQNSKSLLVLLTLGLLLSCARTPQQLVSEKPVAPIDALTLEKIRDSIVRIESENASGTGFFVSPDKIATNSHVVAHSGPIYVKSPDKEKNWTIEGVVAYDVENNLVILKLTGEGMPLPLEDSSAVQIGESVSIPGYPDGEYKVTESSIQSIRKRTKWLRINTTTSKETNGSPVLNDKGQVIGVIVPYDIGFYSYAIPSSALEALLEKSMPIEPLSEWQQRKHVRAAAYYSLGEKKLVLKDYTGAITDLDKAIELHPEYLRAHYERGRAQAYLGDYDSGIASCTQVIKMDPEDADAYYVRGSVKARRGDYAEAIVDLDKAIELDAEHANAYSNRGGVKFRFGESETARGNAKAAQRLYEAAIADCDKAIQIDPEHANPYNNRGGVKFKFGESETARGNTKKAQSLYESAIADCTQSIKIDPEDANTYNNRGLAKTALGELESTRGNVEKTQDFYESAIADYTQSIKVNIEDDLAYNNRGLMKFRLGKSEAARGNTKAAQHFYESAIVDYTQSIKVNPEDANTYNNRGLAKTAFGKLESTRGNTEKTEDFYESAIADCTQAIKINPKYADAYDNRATVKCKLGDIESEYGDAEKARRLYHEGITDYDKAIQLNNPENADAQTANLESQKGRDSTVRVMSWTGNFYTGSGFFVDKDKIVTNIHVIAQPGPIFATLKDKETIWQVEGVSAFDVGNDLVILKLAGEGTPLALGDSNVIQSGETTVTMGYPNKKYKVARGTIHSTRNSDKWIRIKVNGISRF